ncbi:PAS-domain containing protein [Primorskyibacter sedentarius]|uniref:PAS-domain containing protein n=1 Tax=Primorskyibacter sedentarius TaxID=745311 RepID=UPI003EC1218D
MIDIYNILIVCAAALVTALVILALLGKAGGETPHAGRPASDAEPAISALFRGQDIVDATDEARALITGSEESWAELSAALRPRFPSLPGKAPTERRLFASGSPGDDGYLELEQVGSRMRLSLCDRPANSADLHQLRAAQTELEVLRTALGTAPNPIWKSDETGRTDWSNKAYESLAADVASPEPGAPIFDMPPGGPEHMRTRRTCLASPKGDAQRWFDITSAQQGNAWLHYGIDVTAVVRAEIAQRNFVQTLTKTFAHLPIGLAIFDRNRQLALFNPAMIDLTQLSAEFLSGRPNLLSFFDRLREGRMMPEPKNYNDWREQMADLVAAASDDRYSETWSLPSGLTYKVTGRPHPDGAIAFLIEDISAEISLTRRFRSELELSQCVIDTLDDAIAIFSQNGVLTFSNAAYRTLWKSDPDSSFAELTVVDATRQWQEMCKPSPIWGELRDFVVQGHDRAAWEMHVEHKNNMRILCRVTPVAGGSTLVSFNCETPALPQRQLNTEGV